MSAQPMSSDELLEKRIEQERVAMTEAEDPESRRSHFQEMRNLIAQRSETRVEEMERERNLR